MVRTVYAPRGGTNEKKRRPITTDVAQGKREQTEYEKAIEERKKAQEQIPGPVEEKSTLTRVAEFGLYPAAWTAKQINKVFKVTDQDLSTSEIAEMTAEYSPGGVPVGKALGITTVALEAYLGGKLAARAFPRLASKIPKPKLRLRGGSKNVIPRIPDKVVERAASKAGLSRAGMAQVKRELGKMRVAEIAKSLSNSQGSILSRYLKGSFKTARISGAGILGWLGADTIAQSASMQAAATEKSVIFGQLSRSEGEAYLNQYQTNNNVGKGALLAAAAIAPAAIPLLAFGYASTRSADTQIEKSRKIIQRV